nr:hypothetical protein [Tanacetum cinerariifolium]
MRALSIFWDFGKEAKTLAKGVFKMKLFEHIPKLLNLNIIFLLLFLFQHSGGIRDTRWKRVPSMNNKISLNWRLRFLDWRRWWNLDVVLCMIWVCVRLLYTFILLWINGFGRIGNGRSFSNKSLSSPFGLAMVLPERVPDPEVEAVFICKRLAIMFLISLVWLDKEV